MYGNIYGFFKHCKFYISTYFDREFLLQCNVERAYEEMHILAYIYHWDRNSLWNVPILERRKWVQMIVDQKNAENEALEKN